MHGTDPGRVCGRKVSHGRLGLGILSKFATTCTLFRLVVFYLVGLPDVAGMTKRVPKLGEPFDYKLGGFFLLQFFK